MSTSTRRDDQRKDHIDPKRTLVKETPKKKNNHRPITCLPMMWKVLKSRRLFPEEKERMLQRIQRHSRGTLHISAHPKREQDQTEKSSYGLD